MVERVREVSRATAQNRSSSIFTSAGSVSCSRMSKAVVPPPRSANSAARWPLPLPSLKTSAGRTTRRPARAIAAGPSYLLYDDRFAGRGYGDFKKALAEVLVEGLAPIRSRYEELMSDTGELEALLRSGAERASAVAEETLAAVRSKIGLYGAAV